MRCVFQSLTAKDFVGTCLLSALTARPQTSLRLTHSGTASVTLRWDWWDRSQRS